MSAFICKLIAAAAMLIDHAGLMLFPGEGWMRIVGRLAFPIFAFFIAEGFRYTRSRLQYFLRLFLLGAACQIVYYVAAGDTLIGILIAFSISVLLMWLADAAKKAFREGRSSRYALAVGCAAALAGLFVLCHYVEIDYGFFGILLPVWISLFEDRRYRLAAMAVGLGVLCAESWLAGGQRQIWSMLTVPMLYFYDGTPGKYRMKWFFYIFYPVHLAVLQLIAWVT